MMEAPQSLKAESLDFDFNRQRLRSSSAIEAPTTKRVRKGSISGRLRTASDLEELGFISKNEKGLIKDLIISGDVMLQSLLDKYEQGDGEELLALIRKGYLARKPSVELIDGLDFDFINALRSGDEQDMILGGPSIEINNQHDLHVKQERRASTVDVEDLFGQYRSRRSSLDAFALQELLMFDHPPIQEGGAAHGQHSHGPHNLQPELYEDIFQQFADEGEGMLDGQDGQGQGQPVLDLSAYAMHAAHLQQRQKGGHHVAYGFGMDDEHGGILGHGHHSSHDNNGNNNNSSPSKEYGRGMRHSGTTTSLALRLGLVPGTHHNSHNNNNNNSNNKGGGGQRLANPNNGNNSNSNNSSSSHAKASLQPAGTIRGHSNNQSSTAVTHQSSLAQYNPSAAYQQGQLQSPAGLQAALQGPRPAGFIGAYSPEQRRQRIDRFLEKRTKRVWARKVKYDVRKNFADSRLRIKGRFVKKEDEDMMRDLLHMG